MIVFKLTIRWVVMSVKSVAFFLKTSSTMLVVGQGLLLIIEFFEYRTTILIVAVLPTSSGPR